MNDENARAVSLSLLLVLAAVAGTVTFAGTAAAAASNVSISPDDDAAGAASVTYTAEATVTLSSDQTLQHVDVRLGPADVSNVTDNDVSVFIRGSEYTDGFSQFDASDGTVEFKLSNSRNLNDGDRIRIVISESVTNPSEDFDATVTLNDTADARFESFSDGVAIDSGADIAYSDLSVNDTTLEVGEDLKVTATVENTGEQSGTFSASLKVDGSVRAVKNGTLAGGERTTVSFVTSIDSVGDHDVTVETLAATEVSVRSTGSSGAVEITGGSADPDNVAPGATVNNQRVHVRLSEVSQDGDTDTHFVEFPNALASGLSVNSVSASETSVTSSPELVEGFDDDGAVDTVRFATSGDGGGEIDLRLTVDVSVDYPTAETTYGIDARTEDSDNGAAQASDVATIDVSEGGGSSGGSTGGSGGSAGGSGGAGTSDSVSNDTATTTPEVVSFAVSADGHDVTVTVVSSSQVEDLRVAVGGPVEVELTRSSFTRSRANGNYAYTAEFWVKSSGTVRGRLETVVAGGGDIAGGQVDTAVITASRNTTVGATASPPWVGDRSTHTFVVPVHGIRNETLGSVTVAYSDAFRNESGSVTSVSDDQNVVTLMVVSANGTVESRMGGTDAVTVDVVSGEVRLDLSDVDRSRIPTLAPGDRVVVGLRPVTNPETAGRYETDVVIESESGTLDATTTTVRIRNSSGAAAAASAYVSPVEDRPSLDLNGSVVDGVTVGSGAASGGIVRAVVPDPPVPKAADASGRVLATVRIERPAAAANASANVSVRLSTDDLQADADSLVIARYNESAERWNRLETEVTGRSQGHVTLTATTPGTSRFAVIAPEGSQGDTTATPEEGTSSSGPGFGLGVAVVALLSAALLARRRD